MKQTLTIENMKCANCGKNVERAFSSLDGIQTVQIDLEKKLALVETTISYTLSDYQKTLEGKPYQVLELI